MTGAPLRLFNTLGRTLQTFEPLTPGVARIYSCGPTVYAYQHIGNLRAYVFADTLRRTLEWKGLNVRHVINITDVGHLTSDMDEGDDKLELASAREHRTVWDIAAHYTQAFIRDVSALQIRTPAVWAKATEHIQEMIDFAEILEAKDYAYRLDSGLYFDTDKVSDYGKLARLDIKGLREGARVAALPGRRNPSDFALWRASPPDTQRLMEWDSPWGKGAPGWHLECSTMSIAYLGAHFDIHTGGVDHIPVHHSNEIAQSEAYLDGPWVRFWLHNEFLRLADSKISKSKGVTVLLADLAEQGFHPLSYRYLLLNSHYRSPSEFSWEALEAARKAHQRLLERIRERVPHPRADDELNFAVAAAKLGSPGRAYPHRLDAAVSADLNTAQALAVLTVASRDADLPPADLFVLTRAAETLLAIGLLSLDPDNLDRSGLDTTGDRREIEQLIVTRARKRQLGDYAAADEIREKLLKLGITVADTPAGTTWRPTT